ncbi:hypothetical protein B0H15DRAFT_98692 [Mycena belliarum]|uniref:Uncharacterized protein n=1 Tax=Mycena belliarum TaxID=1033014 RepID=A0AAD6UAR2_9AGAR|nr:hypothetical protein B0H15DRAFT_98692 [Mycena belliae]
MASPVMHILDKVDYSKHRLVTLPPTPLPPLAPSSLRLQPKILGLTTNNFSYARMGHILGWWDIYPQPENTPAPYNDRATYGRIAAWGYAEIVASTVPDIAVGSTVYGFLPIATLPEDVRIEQTGMKDQIYVVNEHRQHLWKIYNRYTVCPPLAELEKTKSLDYLGWDALMQGLYNTSYNLSTYAFAWEESNRIHPSGEGAWSASDANLDSSTVIILNASGKTGMSFAFALRNNRPKQHQPTTVIGVVSPASKELVEKSGWYDAVLLNTDDQTAKHLVEKSQPRRVVLCDFGARGGAAATWRAMLASVSAPHTFILIGGEVKPQHPDEVIKSFGTPDPECHIVNAGMLRERGIESGNDKYFKEFFAAFDDFKAKGGIPGLTLEWDDGPEAWEKGWEAFCKDEVRASRGLVYRV